MSLLKCLVCVVQRLAIVPSHFVLLVRVWVEAAVWEELGDGEHPLCLHRSGPGPGRPTLHALCIVLA